MQTPQREREPHADKRNASAFPTIPGYKWTLVPEGTTATPPRHDSKRKNSWRDRGRNDKKDRGGRFGRNDRNSNVNTLRELLSEALQSAKTDASDKK